MKKLENSEAEKISGGDTDVETIEYDISCKNCGRAFTVTDSFGLPPSIVMTYNSLCPECKRNFK